MDIQHLARGVVREEYSKQKRAMEIFWNIIQTAVVLLIALNFILNIWFS